MKRADEYFHSAADVNESDLYFTPVGIHSLRLAAQNVGEHAKRFVITVSQGIKSLYDFCERIECAS